MIACQACGHSNPLGRVFCQKCGTKLDLSRVRAHGSSGEAEGGVTVGIRKEEKSRGKTILRNAIRIFDVLLVIGVVAAIILVCQEPPLPNIMRSPSEADKVKLDREKLEYAITAKRAYKMSLSDTGLNSYLASVSDPGKSAEQGMLRTENISVVPEKDLVNVIYVGKIVLGSWQKHIVMQYEGEPVVDGGDFRFRPRRGSIGKLPVPPFAFGVYERNFARLFQNFASERALLGKLTQVQVEPSGITLVYEPTP